MHPRVKPKFKPVWTWVSDYGQIKLPEDFPVTIFRQDGWWDGRYTKLREKWQAWLDAEEEKLKNECLRVDLQLSP